ncbi:MAG: SDR family NAD(P)-dependent oxidoreductase [Crocinitomicaceae bacterium]
MELKLEGKIVLLTGGTGEIGRQICRDFLTEGCRVVCLIRNPEKFEKLKSWLHEKGEDTSMVHAVACNLSVKTELDAAVKEITGQFKRLDILVNCAGSVEEIPFAMMDEERIDTIIENNLKNTLMVTQAVLRPMFLQKAGAIVNVSSITGIKGGRGVTTYAAAKAGIDSFTRTLASEVGKKNIRVNAVRPGPIETAMSKPLKDRIENFIPNAMILGRFGKPEEVSKAVLFLAAEETASYITGSFINVDGGYMV